MRTLRLPLAGGDRRERGTLRTARAQVERSLVARLTTPHGALATRGAAFVTPRRVCEPRPTHAAVDPGPLFPRWSQLTP